MIPSLSISHVKDDAFLTDLTLQFNSDRVKKTRMLLETPGADLPSMKKCH